MTEYILIVFIIFVVLYALIKGCSVNINISVKQEFSQEDRALLEDLFNKDGDPKSEAEQGRDALEELVKSVNSLMLGDEEQING